MGAYTRSDSRGVAEDMERAFTLFPRLKERRTQIAGTLSGGEQQMLAIARALMANPKMLIMDEPSMGLSPIFVERVFDTIKEINEQGVTIFMVEQNAFMALSIAQRAYVLRAGHVVLDGTSDELLASDEVRREYLGGA
jgi:branched-chain amino acid transport system ATP-binding protein